MVAVVASVDPIRLPVQVTVADTPSSAGHGGGNVYVHIHMNICNSHGMPINSSAGTVADMYIIFYKNI